MVIEGDGRAFDGRGRPTADPTPGDPLGLRIARAWPSGPVAWLGRLCQYVRDADPHCGPADWSDGRFSDEAIAAADAAIDQLETDAGARRVVLVGWSGGGVLAALLAARRGDVAGLVTFAAPLDLEAWTRWHGLPPLATSRNPVKQTIDPAVAQVHLFGAFDTTTPPGSAQPAARRIAGGRGVVAILPERHDCCWVHRTVEAANHLMEAAARGSSAPPGGSR